MKLGLQPLLLPISGGAGGFPLLIICHRSRVTASAQARRAAQVGAGEGWAPPYLAVSLCSSSAARSERGGGSVAGADW